MDINELSRLDRMFLEAVVAADKAETALRCYFITHHRVAGVSDLDEYEALQREQQLAADERHRAYLALVNYAKQQTA
ncbi:MAG: hypothetical protein JO307_09505 [Bryobacterales bacterium]|nr:hypothetical protein [Bryobacterales bacterium]MBV9398380.1 hypothetical protein [Bryobacterales bacterium]